MNKIIIFGALMFVCLFMGVIISFNTFLKQEVTDRSTGLMLDISDELNIGESWQNRIEVAGQRVIGLPFDLIFLMIAIGILSTTLYSSYKSVPIDPLYFPVQTFGGLVLGVFFLAIIVVHILNWFYDEILFNIFEFTISDYTIMSNFYTYWYVYFIGFYAINVIVNQFLGNDGMGVNG